jgi:hypothetical protein
MFSDLLQNFQALPFHFSLLSGAHDQDRTDDLVLTKDVLCQLSYMGKSQISLLPDRAKRQKTITPTSFVSERATGAQWSICYVKPDNCLQK